MYFHSKWEEEYKAYYRFWWTIIGRFGINADINMFHNSCGIAVTVGTGHVQFYIAVPFIVSFWLTIGRDDEAWEREISLKFHNWALWWSIWRDPMGGWSSRESKLRTGSLHFDNLIFGKAVYSSEVLEERDIVVPMPEKSYAAKATRTMDRWKYPRRFTREIMRVQIEVPEGIPHEGKGENSYDCGPDATYSMCTPAKSIAEAVGNMVGSSLHDRVHYGGWDDWTWTKGKQA